SEKNSVQVWFCSTTLMRASWLESRGCKFAAASVCWRHFTDGVIWQIYALRFSSSWRTTFTLTLSCWTTACGRLAYRCSRGTGSTPLPSGKQMSHLFFLGVQVGFG